MYKEKHLVSKDILSSIAKSQSSVYGLSLSLPGSCTSRSSWNESILLSPGDLHAGKRSRCPLNRCYFGPGKNQPLKVHQKTTLKVYQNCINFYFPAQSACDHPSLLPPGVRLFRAPMQPRPMAFLAQDELALFFEAVERPISGCLGLRLQSASDAAEDSSAATASEQTFLPMGGGKKFVTMCIC